MKNDHRQRLHLEPKSGWLNDPNGLSWFGGKYHVYFQYAPNSDGSGGKYWGHFQSKDMLCWEYTGTVLSPDSPDDKDGVYSGCGFVHGDMLYLFYTGNVKEKGEHDYIRSGRKANVIMVTTKDGINMSEKKVLLRNCDYPDICSCHVRDPKVWEENGSFHMILGARTLDDKGAVLYYGSGDLENWSLSKSIVSDSFGYMWECPDELIFGENRYLSISPQGLEHERLRYQNVYSSGYVPLDKVSDIDKYFEEWDFGFDFYAPQTFTAPDGRVIMYGWAGIGDIPYKNPTAELGRQHCLTLPCEITEKNGRLYRYPIRELEVLREGSFADINDSGEITLPCELLSDSICGDFEICLGDALRLCYTDGIFTAEFTDSAAGCGRDARNVGIPHIDSIRIILDMSSAEIFLNSGERVMTTRIYNNQTNFQIKVDKISLKVYNLRGMEVKYLNE